MLVASCVICSSIVRTALGSVKVNTLRIAGDDDGASVGAVVIVKVPGTALELIPVALATCDIKLFAWPANDSIWPFAVLCVVVSDVPKELTSAIHLITCVRNSDINWFWATYSVLKAVSYRSRENEIGGFHFHFAPITVGWKWDSRLYYLSAYRWAEIPWSVFKKSHFTTVDFIIVVAWDFGQILTYVPMKWDCEKVWIHIDPEIPVGPSYWEIWIRNRFAWHGPLMAREKLFESHGPVMGPGRKLWSFEFRLFRKGPLRLRWNVSFHEMKIQTANLIFMSTVRNSLRALGSPWVFTPFWRHLFCESTPVPTARAIFRKLEKIYWAREYSRFGYVQRVSAAVPLLFWLHLFCSGCLQLENILKYRRFGYVHVGTCAYMVRRQNVRKKDLLTSGGVSMAPEWKCFEQISSIRMSAELTHSKKPSLSQRKSCKVSKVGTRMESGTCPVREASGRARGASVSKLQWEHAGARGRRRTAWVRCGGATIFRTTWVRGRRRTNRA